MSADAWRRFFDRLDTPLVPVLVTASVYLLFIGVSLARNGFDASVFVTAGDQFVDRTEAPAGLAVQRTSEGYDGQFYYRLALDPWRLERTAFGITLDNAPWREQRIGLPIVVWVLTLGTQELVPAAIIAVNYVALGVLAWVGAVRARGYGHHALFGLVFSLYPGLLLSTRRDTVEVLEACLLLSGLLFLGRGRYLAAAGLLGAAVLVRETAVLVPLAGARYGGGESRMGDLLAPKRARAFVLALIVGLGWQAALGVRWGRLPVLAGGGMPTIGGPAVLSVGSRPRPWPKVPAVYLLEMGFLVALAVVAGLALWASRAPRYEKVAWLLYLALLLAVGGGVWVEDWSFMRVATEFYLFGALVVLGLRDWKAATALLLATLSLWPLLAWDVLRYR